MSDYEILMPDPNEINKEKLRSMFWTSGEALLVGNFLKGISPNSHESGQELYSELAKETDFDVASAPFLISEAKKVLENITISAITEDIDAPNETTNSDEYTYSIAERSKTLSSIAFEALRKSGIWGPDESRRVKSLPGVRNVEKSNFSQDEITGGNIVNKGFLSAEEGGPNVITTIFAPRYEVSKDTSDIQTRKSLGHEIQHIIRAFTNVSLWKGFEEKAQEAGLKTAKKSIGGFKVGSNTQGSESSGDLLARAIGIMYQTGKEPSIAEILPTMSGVLSTGVKKFEVQKLIRPRYFSSKVALIHHLKQLNDLGFGNLPITKLIALTCYGYSSLEKAPELIKLGIMNQKKFEKINFVIEIAASWLTSKDETGFKFKD